MVRSQQRPIMATIESITSDTGKESPAVDVVPV